MGCPVKLVIHWQKGIQQLEHLTGWLQKLYPENIMVNTFNLKDISFKNALSFKKFETPAHFVLSFQGKTSENFKSLIRGHP